MVSADVLYMSRCDEQTKFRSHSAGSFMKLVIDLYEFLCGKSLAVRSRDYNSFLRSIAHFFVFFSLVSVWSSYTSAAAQAMVFGSISDCLFWTESVKNLGLFSAVDELTSRSPLLSPESLPIFTRWWQLTSYPGHRPLSLF